MNPQLTAALSHSVADLERRRRQQQALQPMLEALRRRVSAESRPSERERLVRGYLKFAGSCRKSVGTDLTCEALESALRLQPESLELRAQLMGGLEQRNRLHEADRICLQNLDGFSKSDNPSVVLNLARMHWRMRRHEEAVDLLKRLFSRPLPERQGAEARFLYADNLHRLGEYAAAFEAYERANRSVAESREANRYAPEAKRLLDRIRDELEWQTEGGRFPEPPAVEDGLPRPLFLVGFPRSGTTLLEQILASHPALLTLSERPLLAPLLTPFNGPRASVSRRLSKLKVKEITAFRAAYRQRLLFFRGEGGGEGGVIDKLPLNINNLALIRFFFPEARIMMALRDPRDVLLSNFMQHFDLNGAMWFSFELARLVSFYRSVMALYLRNRQAWAEDLLEVRYEALVTEIEDISPLLWRFLGISQQGGEPDYVSAARERRIYTPSYHQVVEPLHGEAIGRWKRYAPFTARYFSELRPSLRQLEYD